MPTFHGYVEANNVSFRPGPDGALFFQPFNTNYATVHPAENPTGPFAVELVLHDGEYFQVQGDLDMSEGRGGTSPAGNFLHYPDAYSAARGKGAQGSIAAIVIRTRNGTTETTAQSRYGATVVLSIDTSWRTVSIPSRVNFPYRDPATGEPVQ